MRRPSVAGAPTAATIEVLIPNGHERLGPIAVPILGPGWTNEDLFNIVIDVALDPATRLAVPLVDARTTAKWLHRDYGNRLYKHYGVRRFTPDSTRLAFDGLAGHGLEDRFPFDRYGRSRPAPYSMWPKGFDAPVGPGWPDWTPPEHTPEPAPF